MRTKTVEVVIRIEATMIIEEDDHDDDDVDDEDDDKVIRI